MRAIVQRVNNASVSTDGEIVGKINKGYLVLLGVTHSDAEEDVDYLVNKISKLRIMVDINGKMNLDLKDSNGSILVVSQFTLHANTKDGNRPSFTESADAETARKLYTSCIDKLKSNNITIETGSFGKDMKIHTELDGPVTIIFDTQS